MKFLRPFRSTMKLGNHFTGAYFTNAALLFFTKSKLSHCLLLLTILSQLLIHSNASAGNAIDADTKVEIRYAINRFPAYPMELLKEALATQTTAYSFVGSDTIYQQRRSFISVNEDVLNITMSMTSNENEGILNPIRIPLYKGLIGWRLAIVNQNNPHLFRNVSSPDQLKNFKAGLMHDWPDMGILKHNGLSVYGSSSFEGLFNMVEEGRINYFPRSIIEVYEEVQDRPNKKLQVDEHIVIYYPTAFYYFVKATNGSLASDIEKGLEILIRNGKFNRIFMKYHEHYLKRAHLHNRKLLRLENPLLPELTPLHRPELWLQAESIMGKPK